MRVKRSLRNRHGLMMTITLVAVMAGGIALAEGIKADRGMQAHDPQQAPSEVRADAEHPAEDTYPLDTCIVSGGKLGSMGEPVIYEHEGREIRFCCKGCVGQFEKDPERYLKAMDEAIIEKQLPDYPLETCMVMGRKLGSGDQAPIDLVYDNHLVRLCCQKCVEAFEKDPAKYLKKLDEARQKTAAGTEAETQMMQKGMMDHQGNEDDLGQMQHNRRGHGSCGGH